MQVVLQGLGEIGKAILSLCLERGYEVVGAVDISPTLIGRDVGELLGTEKLGIEVSSSLTDVLEKNRPDALIQATTSYLNSAYEQFKPALERGIDIISTCETLVYPYYRYPELASEIDSRAKRSGSSVLGAGINPGYLLDLLPAFLTAPCAEVRTIRAVRQLDAAKRRASFRRKVGLGIELSEFEELHKRGELSGHVGMAESACLLAKAMSRRTIEVREEQRAVIAEEQLEVEGLSIGKGKVKGVEALCEATCEGGMRVELVFRAVAGAEEFEEIAIEGRPSVRWRSSGTPGDLATVAIAANALPLLIESPPGLRTLDELRTLSMRVYLGGRA